MLLEWKRTKLRGLGHRFADGADHVFAVSKDVLIGVLDAIWVLPNHATKNWKRRGKNDERAEWRDIDLTLHTQSRDQAIRLGTTDAVMNLQRSNGANAS